MPVRLRGRGGVARKRRGTGREIRVRWASRVVIESNLDTNVETNLETNLDTNLEAAGDVRSMDD
jgi:hypothetical protein